MNELNIAVLGLGRVGCAHARNLSQSVKGANLKMVADPLEGKAESIAKELNVPKWSENPLDAIQDEAIDAIVIVTPTNTHGEMIIKAAEHGKHVFVEKPLTDTLEEADKVIKVIEEKQIICQVGFMRRFDPAYFDAKQRILAGEIGKPIYFKGITRDQGCPPASFIKHSGGAFLDISIHDYDIARYLMDDEIVSVAGHGRVLNYPYIAEYGDVDQAISYVEFKSGAVGDIEASRNSPYGHDIRTEIIGTEGSLFIGTLRNQDVTVMNDNGSTYEVIPDFQTRFGDAYRIELEEFIKTIRANEKPRVTALDSKINMQIALIATDSFNQQGEKLHVGGNKDEQVKL